jgi:protein-disulfide isomerase
MMSSRRSILSLAAGATGAGLLDCCGWFAPAVWAQAAANEAEHQAERAIGNPDAKVTVLEFFSLTCTHCAAFSRETMPEVEKNLVQLGKVRFVYRDFPLDQVALTAAMVARYLPPPQYYPFVTALFANQDRWAFARGVNSTDELWKMAALAGMSRPTFDQAIGDTNLRNWILQQQQADQDRWKIDATPSFVINGQKYSGEMSYDAFRKLIPEV